MTDNPRRGIERMREQLDAAEGVAEPDAQLLLELSDTIDLLGPSQYSDQRHEFYLKRGTRIARGIGTEDEPILAPALEDRTAAERIVRWINTEHTDSAETNKDYRTTLRMIGELVTDGDGKPESIEWVPGGYPDGYDPAPQPEKMYRWDEHIEPMIEVCRNSRDRALVALAADLGPRPSELFDLTVDRFSDHKHGMKATLYGGKQGTRSPLIVPAAPYVRQWLRDHPARGEEGAPLWTRTTRATAISNNRIRDIFKEKAQDADMEPPATPTPRRMRKSSASHLASRGVSQAFLEDHHGWTRGSDIAARYIAVFDDANDREIAQAYGIDIDTTDEPEPVGPIECPRCQRDTPRTEAFCMWCDQAIQKDAQASIEADQREHRTKLLRLTTQNPDLLDAAEEMEPVIELFGGDPDLIDAARQFAEATRE